METLHELMIATGEVCKECTLPAGKAELSANRGMCHFCRMAEDDRHREAGRDD